MQFVSEDFHYFCFQVIPTIVPFTFGDEQINLDDSIMLSCSVLKGDLPLHIWWTFSNIPNDSGYNLTSDDGVVIMRNSQKISILSIDSVKARHMGNYTCFAKNKGGISQFSAQLHINGLILLSYLDYNLDLR